MLFMLCLRMKKFDYVQSTMNDINVTTLTVDGGSNKMPSIRFNFKLSVPMSPCMSYNYVRFYVKVPPILF